MDCWSFKFPDALKFCQFLSTYLNIKWCIVVEQKYGNTHEKARFTAQYGVEKPLRFKTACNLQRMDKYCLCMLLTGIFFYSSCKMAASSGYENDGG